MIYARNKPKWLLARISRLRLMIAMLALGCLTWPEALSAHEADHTHPSLAAASFQLLGESSFYFPGDMAKVLSGTIEEDSPASRVLNHFYNPMTGQNTIPFAEATAKDKAVSFWQDAVDGYFPGSYENFRDLGRVLHLLQDMTSPAHVHNDAHAGVFTGCEAWGSIDDFERWGWCTSAEDGGIRAYVSPVTAPNGQVIGGWMTPRLSGLTQSKILLPLDLSPAGFIDELAWADYSMTTFQGALTTEDEQPDSELHQMFPGDRLRRGSLGAWFIENIGNHYGACGGGVFDQWWSMEDECGENFYIQNSGGSNSSLIPAVWLKPGVHPTGPNTTRLLEIYGDNLYTLATRYGAGLLKVYQEVIEKTPPFTDIREEEEKTDWFVGYVRYMSLQGVIQGYEGGSEFRPDKTITRAEALKMAYGGAGAEISNTITDPGFADVGPGDWFYTLVADAKARHFISGVNCGAQQCFKPNEAINRAEAVKLTSVLLEVDVDHPEHIVNDTPVPFQDVDDSDWFDKYVQWLTSSTLENGFEDLGLPSGVRLLQGFDDKKFHPERTITRAEMAKLLTHAMLYCRATTRTHECGPQSGLTDSPAAAKLSSSAKLVTMGFLYEQVSNASDLNSLAPFHLPGGDDQVITGSLPMNGDALDADDDSLFYFWSADGGSFTTSDPENFSRVTWTPPAVAEDTLFRIHVVRGDRKGLVGRSAFRLLVPGTASNSPGSGTITSPNGTQTGLVTVSATASDPDGLGRVSVTFVSGGPELVLCGADGPAPCSGSSGTWSKTGVNPASYGASSGTVTLSLSVQDVLGDVRSVDTHAFTFSPPIGPTFKLTVLKEGNGTGTVSGNGVVCGPGCTSTSVNLPQGSSVTLSGSAATGSVFVGFMGYRCYGVEPCTFTMSSDQTVYAAFGLPDALAINYTTPSNGDTGVATSAEVDVHFNRDIAVGPNYAGLSLRESGGASVPFTPVVRSTDRRLVFLPSSALGSGKSYVVTIPVGAVSDTQGNPLAVPYSFTFTTAVAGTPKMYISAYPPHVMEGSKTKVSIWFETPSSQDRTITLTSTPAGALLHPGEVILEAGKTLVELQVEAPYNHGSTSPVTATFSAAASGAGQQSVQVIVANYTSVTGASLKWQAASVVSDTDHDGVFEAGEIADIRFEVANFGPAIINNVVLEFAVSNGYGISILGGAPFTCNLGSIAAGHSTNCTRSFRANSDVPTADYFIEVKGTSSANGILAQTMVRIVNNLQPDFVLVAGSFTSAELQPGTTVEMRYTPRNDTDGFSDRLPVFEVTLEMEGTEHLLYRLPGNARGYIWNDQTFKLPLVVPPVPGTHTIRARINPPAADRIPEANYNNNDATVLTLRVAGPNQPPVLNSIPSPLSAQVGRSLSLPASATDPNNDPITYSLGTKPAGATINATSGVFTWTPACGQGPASYPVSILASDPKGATDTESFTIQVGLEADLGLTQTASSESAVPGQTIGLTLVVTNHGPSCVTGATLADLFPAGLTEVSWTCTASAGSSCAAGGTGNIGSSPMSLVSGGTATYAVTARVADTASSLVITNATVAAPAGTADPNGTNNSASATVTLRGLDFGDAPGASLGAPWAFPTRLAENGARHGVVPEIRLGPALDAEPDGQPSLAASGDDGSGARDEDGVALPEEFTPCQSANLQVTASASGFLNAWVDFNTDGDWSDAGERVALNQPLSPGNNPIAFVVPCEATSGGTSFARFRYNSTGNLGVSGLAMDGEVEDYSVRIAQVPPADPPGLDFYSITPCRILDTRTSAALASLVPRSFPAAELCGVPATARAVVLNVTVVSPTGNGYVSLWPADLPWPQTSVINFSAGTNRANNAIVGLATDGGGDIAAQASVGGSGTVHLVLDVSGYFQ